jgi:long-chain acyl-CoA synthetase
MREYSSRVVVEVAPSALVTDVVFDRAARTPATVMLRRKRGVGPRFGPPGGGQASQPATGSSQPADSPTATVAGAPVWEDVTAAQFRDEVSLLAKGLIANGIGAHDRVALLARTRYEWTLADYAIWAAGAVTVPIYETSSAEQVDWILTDSGARALIVETPAHLQNLLGVVQQSGVKDLWLIEGGPIGTATGGGGSDGSADAGTSPHPLTALATDGEGVTEAELLERRTSLTGSDLATIIYTSGTTGRPKGCQITHGNLLNDVRNAVHGPLRKIFDVEGASTLLFLPLAHSFARIIEVGCLEAGVILGHSPDPKPTALIPDLSSYQPTFILAVPRVFEKVYNSAEQQASASAVKGRIFRAATQTAIDWSRSYGMQEPGQGSGPGLGLRMRHAVFDRLVYGKLRAAIGGRAEFAVSGGAPLGERLGHFFRGAGITIIEGYGLTETTAAATVNRPERNKIGTVGQPLPGVSVRIADDGEILLAGPNIFPGYWRNEAATAQALAEGRWMRTGDVGELDDEGYLRVTGRKKELIVTAGGKNVAPSVLEDRIRAHPLVSQCVVVGDGRPYVACLVTLDDEALSAWKERAGRPADATPADLREDPALNAELQRAVDAANKAVSRAESIRRFRILARDLTEQDGYLTPSLKVRRSLVMKDFAQEIDALYS